MGGSTTHTPADGAETKDSNSKGASNADVVEWFRERGVKEERERCKRSGDEGERNLGREGVAGEYILEKVRLERRRGM